MVSAGILLVVTIVILVSSFKRAPGVGVIAALVIIGLTVWLRGDGLAGLGFFPPESWVNTLLWSIVLGAVIQLLSTLWIEPFSDKLTHSNTDHSAFEHLRGNLKNFLLMLVVVWVVVAFVEEVIFRGYMLGEIAALIGTSTLAVILNLLVSSILFGLAHWYQGKSGVLSTGLVGALLGILFIASGYNLWLPILTHGFIDTVGLFMIFANLDKALKEKVRLA